MVRLHFIPPPLFPASLSYRPSPHRPLDASDTLGSCCAPCVRASMRDIDCHAKIQDPFNSSVTTTAPAKHSGSFAETERAGMAQTALYRRVWRLLCFIAILQRETYGVQGRKGINLDDKIKQQYPVGPLRNHFVASSEICWRLRRKRLLRWGVAHVLKSAPPLVLGKALR